MLRAITSAAVALSLGASSAAICIGCSGANATAPAATVTGRWAGDVNVDGANGRWTLDLTETGDAVTGTAALSIAGSQVNTATVTGIRDGIHPNGTRGYRLNATWTSTAQLGEQKGYFMLELSDHGGDDDQLRGMYSVTTEGGGITPYNYSAYLDRQP